MQRELEMLEKEIPDMEKKKTELEATLAACGSNYEKIQELTAALKALSVSIDEKTMRWLEIQEEGG